MHRPTVHCPVENPLLERNPQTTSNSAPHCCFAASTCAPLEHPRPSSLKISAVHPAKPRDCWCPRNRGSKKNHQCTTDCRIPPSSTPRRPPLPSRKGRS